MRRSLPFMFTLVLVLSVGPAALACGGLVGPNGAVNLGRTTTLAGYVDGVEHYVTAFEFAGDGGEFGSIVPLPDIPTNVERAGDWTLQRLVQEVRPRAEAVALAADSASSERSAEVVYETKVDALDITVLRGGGDEVGRWAADHGFRLPPDAPEVLDFYARRSPIFMAARFDGQRAAERGQQIGDGTPIHLTIPTDNPWVPLRILALGKQLRELVEADVFLLTQRKPALLPVRARGVSLLRREPASQALLEDLRSDQNTGWLPADGMWLTYVSVGAEARDVRFDLAADASGAENPSWEKAGLEAPATPAPKEPPTPEPTVPPTPEPTPEDDVVAVVPIGGEAREPDRGAVAFWGAVGALAVAAGVAGLRRARG